MPEEFIVNREVVEHALLWYVSIISESEHDCPVSVEYRKVIDDICKRNNISYVEFGEIFAGKGYRL